MDKQLIIYILIFQGSVFISSCSQILLKKSAKSEHKGIASEYLNKYVIIAYVLFFASTLITTLSYKVIPLSMGPILEASGYIWVSIFGVIFLKEHISKDKLMGLAFIIAGIIVFSVKM